MDNQTDNLLIVLRRLDCNDGVTQQTITLIRGLNTLGWRVTLAAGSVTFTDATEKHLHALHDLCHAVEVLDDKPAHTRMGRARQMLRATRWLIGLIRRDSIHIMHLQGMGWAVCAAAARKITGVPFVTCPALQAAAVNRMARRSLRLANPSHFVAISREIREQLEHTWGVPAKRIADIPNGVDAEYFRPPTPDERMASRRRLGLKADDHAVAMLARLGPIKRQDILVEAVKRLRLAGLPVVGLFAGTGDFNYVKEAMTRAELDERTIRLLGQQNARDVLWASDALALPSDREGFGLVIPEAMLCGLPVVRTPAAGAADQIEDGRTGYLVPFNDPAALAAKLSFILNDSDTTIARAGREYALEHFSASRMCERYDALYREVGPA